MDVAVGSWLPGALGAPAPDQITVGLEIELPAALGAGVLEHVDFGGLGEGLLGLRFRLWLRGRRVEEIG